MHCPRCGSEGLIGQQFCRSCGFNLEQIAELLSEQPPVAANTDIARAYQRQRQLEHWAGIAGLGVLSLVLLLITYLVITEMMIKSGKIGVGLLLLLLFFGASAVAALQGYSKSLKQRLASQLPASLEESSSQIALPHTETRQLDPQREPAQSITESTTELLPAQPPQRNTKEV